MTCKEARDWLTSRPLSNKEDRVDMSFQGKGVEFLFLFTRQWFAPKRGGHGPGSNGIINQRFSLLYRSGKTFVDSKFKRKPHKNVTRLTALCVLNTRTFH